MPDAIKRILQARITAPKPDDLTGMRWEVVLIEAGPSKNGNVWAREVLAAAVPLFADRPIGAYTREDELTGELVWTHLDDFAFMEAGGGLIRNIVGIIHDPRMEGDQVRATMVIHESAEWLGRKLMEMWRGARDKKNFSEVFGLSVDVLTEGVGDEILAITRVQSVDLVNGPAAGGKLLRAVATNLRRNEPMWELILSIVKAANPGLATRLEAFEAKDLDALKEADPELWKEIEGIPKVVKALADGGGEDPPAEDPPAEDPPAEDPPAEDPPAEDPPAEDPPAEDLPVEDKAVAASIADLRKKQAEMEKRLQRQRDSELAGLVREAKLPEQFGKILTGKYKGTDFATSAVKSDIREIRAGLARATESAEKDARRAVEGEMFPTITLGSTEYDKTVAGATAMIMNQPTWFYKEKHRVYIAGREIETERLRITTDPKRAQELGADKASPFHGVQHLYLHCMGADDPTMNFNALRRKEAIDTAAVTSVLRDALHTSVGQFFREAGDWQAWRNFCNVVSVPDFKNQYQHQIGGYADLPTVAEGTDYQALTTPSDYDTNYVIEQRGGTETLTLQAIRNDATGTLRRIPRHMGRALSRTLAKNIYSVIEDNETWGGDSTALLTVAHANLSTATISSDNIWAMAELILSQTEGTSSERLGIRPKFLLVRIGKARIAAQALKADWDAGQATRDTVLSPFRATLPLFGAAGTSDLPLMIIVVPNWTASSTVKWAMVADPADTETIEVGFLDGIDEPQIDIAQDPNGGQLLLQNDSMLIRAKLTWGRTAREYRGIAGSTTD